MENKTDSFYKHNLKWKKLDSKRVHSIYSFTMWSRKQVTLIHSVINQDIFEWMGSNLKKDNEGFWGYGYILPFSIWEMVTEKYSAFKKSKSYTQLKNQLSK